MSTSRYRATIDLIRWARDFGTLVPRADNRRWLLHMAINRRAGWQDDPGCYRGSCMPVNGKYPRKAIGETYHHLLLLSREINTPRLIVRMQTLGEWRALLAKRMAHRFEEVE